MLWVFSVVPVVCTDAGLPGTMVDISLETVVWELAMGDEVYAEARLLWKVVDLSRTVVCEV